MAGQNTGEKIMSHRILVIDDEEAVRKSFILALDQPDYQVDVADSGQLGLKLFVSKSYDLIFLDLKMPGKSGVETLRDLRALDAEVPIYIITAFDDEYFSQLIAAAADGINFEIISKPLGSERISLIAMLVFNCAKGM